MPLASSAGGRALSSLPLLDGVLVSVALISKRARVLPWLAAVAAAAIFAFDTLPPYGMAVAVLYGLVVQMVAGFVNAMQAMATVEEPRELRVRVGRGEPGWAELSAADSGSDLSSDSATRLFDPFFSTESDGVGMGPSICRSIVEAHGGGISAGNRPDGRGAEFRFTLPILKETGS